MPELQPVAVVAKSLGVSTKTLQRAVRDGLRHEIRSRGAAFVDPVEAWSFLNQRWGIRRPASFPASPPARVEPAARTDDDPPSPLGQALRSAKFEVVAMPWEEPPPEQLYCLECRVKLKGGIPAEGLNDLAARLAEALAPAVGMLVEVILEPSGVRFIQGNDGPGVYGKRAE